MAKHYAWFGSSGLATRVLQRVSHELMVDNQMNARCFFFLNRSVVVAWGLVRFQSPTRKGPLNLNLLRHSLLILCPPHSVLDCLDNDEFT